MSQKKNGHDPSMPVTYGGRVVQMRKFTSRDYVAVRKGSLDDVELIEMTLGAIIDYGDGDPWDLSPNEVSDLMAAWLEAAVAAALPPTSA